MRVLIMYCVLCFLLSSMTVSYNSCLYVFFFFFSSRRRHTRYWRDWSSDVCSSDLALTESYEVDSGRIEKAVREILIGIGEDPDREGLLGTPERVADAYAYLFAGLGEDLVHHLEVGFAEDYSDTVLVRDIPLYSICEHHLIPFVGKAHVGYAPHGRVVGLSKLARLVEGYARRPQLQEQLTAQIADALCESLGSRGSIA